MMRKFLLIALACAPIFLLAQAQRLSLVEHFTNASCPPCASQNPDFNALLRANPDKIISIKYQAPFPGFDPMNQQNPGEVATRSDYYGLSGVPTAWLDGFTGDDSYGGGIGDWNIAGGGYAGGPYGHNQAVIDYASSQTTPISMVVTHELNEDATELSVTVAVTNQSAEDFSMADGRLQVALVERDIIFPEPPGSTSEFHFEEVMRKMYPSAEGTNMATIPAGMTWETTITGAVPDYIYGLNELRVIAWVQDHTSKEVWQAAYTEPQVIANGYDAALGQNLTADPEGLCGAVITPEVELTNNGGAEITQATVVATINEGVVGTFELVDPLAGGASVTITFDELALTEANNLLSFAITSVNDGMGLNLNTLNDETIPTGYGALSETPIGTELMEDMEDYPFDFPGNSIVTPSTDISASFLVVSADEFGSPPPIPVGAYGESAKSVIIDFYNWNPSNAPDLADLIYQKIDLTDAPAAQLSFDRAGTGYPFGSGNSSDGLDVSISTDCGDTWTSVWAAEGSDLYTVPAQTGFYVPQSASDWTTETIDVSEFVGNEVLVRFRAITDWGNSLFLDNINLMGIVGTEELTEVSEISLFPNPADDMLRVDFDLEEASQLQVEVFNATGQRVQQLGAENYNTGRNQLTLDVSQLSNGVYFLRMFNADRELNRRFIVQH